MARKYASLNTLQTFLSNLKDLFATKAEMNKKADVQIIAQDDTETIIENVSTLKIHKLSQEQYQQKVENGDVDENTLYLTPDKEIDLTPYVTVEQLNEKADAKHNHSIDDIANLQDTLDINLESANQYTDIMISTHNHDSVYDAKGSAENALNSAKSYADSVSATAANSVKNDLLNGAGDAYDTLKELGDLIDDNADAIDALEAIATNKANVNHTHTTSEISDLQEQLSKISQVQIITWEADD